MWLGLLLVLSGLLFGLFLNFGAYSIMFKDTHPPFAPVLLRRMGLITLFVPWLTAVLLVVSTVFFRGVSTFFAIYG